jgi:hypothetical protein
MEPCSVLLLLNWRRIPTLGGNARNTPTLILPYEKVYGLRNILPKSIAKKIEGFRRFLKLEFAIS